MNLYDVAGVILLIKKTFEFSRHKKNKVHALPFNLMSQPSDSVTPP
jgi:hypothetical protein